MWGRYYTELFFLDEVTAFAAGHRPCFECRRRDAELFARLFSGKRSARRPVQWIGRFTPNAWMTKPNAPPADLDMFPDGAMIALDGEAFAVRGKRLLRWTPAGYAHQEHDRAA